MKRSTVEPKFALCLRNDHCDDLEVRKVYQVIPDPEAAKEGYIRIVDESGEDYLYPESYFVLVDLPHEASSALAVPASKEAGVAARTIKAERVRLGLSAKDFGRLVGVSGLTIYSWESGKSRPRKKQLAGLAAVRRLGKREARKRLNM